jgi:hypothetical protein
MFAISRGCPECGAVAGEMHLQPCSFHERYEAAARSPLVEWLASLPAEYERLKAHAAANAVPKDRLNEAG